MFSVVLLVVVLVLTLLYWNSRVPKGMPPGFMGLPLVGWPPLTMKDRRRHFEAIRKRYGSITTSRWGGLTVVLLTDSNVIRRCRVHPFMQARLKVLSYSFTQLDSSLGVVNASGTIWTQNRKFMLRHLSVIGTSGMKQEPVISQEVAQWLQYLEEMGLDKPVEVDWSVNITILNILFKMFAGVRFEFNDNAINNVYNLIDEAANISAHSLVMLFDVYPWLNNIIPTFIRNKFMHFDKLLEIKEESWRVFKKILEDRRKVFDRDNPETLIDHYFIEAEEYADDPDSPFNNENNLLQLIGDFFVAGSETTASAIRWTVLYLALYPESQQKIHDALDRTVPKDRTPSLADKDNLAYLEAVLMEVMRITSLFPMTLHKATEDTELQGYFIPKGMVMVSCLETVHRDPSEWEKPHEFYPEHFLDEEGRLRNRKNAFIPFGMGKRICLGEELARAELFLFVSALLQRFRITEPPGVSLEKYAEPVFSIVNYPKMFPVMLERRTEQ